SRSGRAHALEYLSLIAAHNRCASGVSAALPAYPFYQLTLTSGMSQFGPASGSLTETRGSIMTAASPAYCFKVFSPSTSEKISKEILNFPRLRLLLSAWLPGYT
ncbi:hypothetical protein VBJ03_21010, partial [Enterobacter hormaechei]|nr:hypothetical protein [Enterobacter hormaechei]